jgi:hypothetical protein
MRTVDVLGRQVPVLEAEAIAQKIREDIHKLGPAEPPPYTGPTGEALQALVRSMLADTMRSLRRGGFPHDGVVSQFGTTLQREGWRLSVMPDYSRNLAHAHGTRVRTRNMIVHLALAETYGLDEDGRTCPIAAPEAVMDAIKRTFKSDDSWHSRQWISFRMDGLPDSLAVAYENYVPLTKQSEGMRKFQEWFLEGLK